MKDSNELEFELLIEIAKLLKRYGPETFENLARTVSSPESIEKLISILTTAAKAHRASQSKRRTKRTPTDFRSKIARLEESEPEKSHLLMGLYDGLTSKALLPTLRDIKAFVSDSAREYAAAR